MNSFWECDRLFFEDLPTVRDLIRSADQGILAREIARADGPGVERARAALEDMLSLDAKEPSKKWAFLPYVYYSADEGRGLITCEVDAALVRRRDFKAMKQLAESGAYSHSAAECRKALKREAERLGGAYPNLYSWELTPWRKTLACRVWMKGEFSRKERYQTLACIVRDMMFFGSTWSEARREQRAATRSLTQSAKAAAKGKVRTSPGELLFRDYGLESSTDDYESEYEGRMQDIAFVLNRNAAVDLHRRVADLVKCEKRAEKHNFPVGNRPFGSCSSHPCKPEWNSEAPSLSS